MIAKKILVLSILFVFLALASAQQSPSVTITNTLTQTVSISGTYSPSSSYSLSQTWTNTGSYTGSSSYSGSQSYTNSNSYTISTTASFSISGTVSAAIGYPQITGIVNTINDLFSLNIVWQRPVGFNYQSYQLFLIINGTSVTFNDIPTETLFLTAANTNGLVQPGQSYIVQVRGFLNGAFGPQSLPVQVSTSGGDFYGTVGTDLTSINSLSCNYFPQSLRCTWSTGSRPWINATFYVQCERTVTPILGAMGWIVQKVLNTAGSTTLPTTSVIPLPSGCSCGVHLTAYYSTVAVRVDLDLTAASTGFVNTNKANIRPNTPLTVVS